MKLWYSTTSAFVRKVTLVARYHGLEKQIEILNTVNSFDANSPHNQDNPLGKIPALQLDNGQWLCNSSVIAEYLDSIGTQPTLFPKDERRWQVMGLYALVEGVMENTTSLMIPERRFRPEQEWWHARHQQVIARNERSLTLIAQQLQRMGTEFNIATLYAVCMIDFFVFRAETTSANQYSALPELVRWVDEMNARYPWLAESKPYSA